MESRLIADPDTCGPRLWTRQDGSQTASFERHARALERIPERGRAG